MIDPTLERDPKLAEVVRRLVEAYRPERIYLFGSMARGDVGPDSDYDLLVIVPDEAPPERRDGGLAYRALWGVGTAVDAVVCTSGWFHARTHLKANRVHIKCDNTQGIVIGNSYPEADICLG